MMVDFGLGLWSMVGGFLGSACLLAAYSLVQSLSDPRGDTLGRELHKVVYQYDESLGLVVVSQ